MTVSKRVAKSGAVTLPRQLRQETGILPGVPVDIEADEDGVHIRKHVPTCHFCGTVDDVRSEERRVGKECRSRWSPYH